MVSVTLRTRTALPSNLPVEEVRVRVFDVSGETFITEGDTDADGLAVFTLDDTTSYWVRFFKSGWKWPMKARIFVDETSGAVSFDARGVDLLESPPSTDPALCSVGGIIANAAGIPVRGVTVRFIATGVPQVLGRRAIIPSRIEATSREFGIFEVELIKGAEFEVSSEGLGGLTFDDFSSLIRVPDTDYVLLTDLLWPYLLRVDAVDDPVALSVGSAVELPISAVLSNGVTTPFLLGERIKRATDYVVRVNSDEGVVEAALTLDGTQEYLSLTGKKAGSATISFVPIEGTSANRLPVPVADLPTIAVTVS